jgi:hypothetical protein
MKRKMYGQDASCPYIFLFIHARQEHVLPDYLSLLFAYERSRPARTFFFSSMQGKSMSFPIIFLFFYAYERSCPARTFFFSSMQG